MKPATAAPLVAHVIYRLDVGGLENGLVNLINALPEYRHAVICVDDYTSFRTRIERPDVAVFALKKRPGMDLSIYTKLYRLFRQLQPAIVHTRNLAGLDSLVPAFAAGVPVRIHGEHGREPDERGRYRWLRRAAKPFVHHYIALSRDLETYLQRRISIKSARISQIYNGVDVTRFRPREAKEALAHPFAGGVVVGWAGRMKEVKNPLALVRAFIEALKRIPEAKKRLRLVMVGDGPLREPALAALGAEGFAEFAWMPGAREDIHGILRGLDVFVVPSLNEGISNSILEAMACGLPVIATNVGGNAELVEHDACGKLIPSRDIEALADAIGFYFLHPEERVRHGREARRIAETRFSLGTMVRSYGAVYERLLRERAPLARVAA